LERLCFQLGRKADLSSSELSALNLLAQVHDLGKVGIPDHILFKPGPLNDDEWKIMRQHPEKGYRIAQETTDLAGIADLILKHHERWDGKGYPLGLKGHGIPVECRILAIVDSFDAMTNDRPYRKAISVQEALEELRKGSGSQFDPQLVQHFLAIMPSDIESIICGMDGESIGPGDSPEQT
jgi:HD-GYP domain-containing protein (c-di-GMP phosphodiesterase class II)